MSTTLEKSSGKSDKSVRKKIEELGDELAYLQRKSRELGIPVLIIVEGLSAAGKGTLINRIIQPLDPRGFKVSCIASPNRDEQLRPFLWRFWRRTPSADRHKLWRRAAISIPSRLSATFAKVLLHSAECADLHSVNQTPRIKDAALLSQ